MTAGQNIALRGDLSTLMSQAGAKISSAVRNAGQKTGVDFSYLLQQARIESSFDCNAKACSSSATGLYQFIDSTWLSMVNRYGDKFGLSNYADAIGDNGKVTNIALKKEILDLRKNPEIASLMAAQMASDNKTYLESVTGQDASSTDLYLAHFMGPTSAGKFLTAMEKSPTSSAASLFPAAAAANKSVFYDAAGKPRSLEGVYALFDKKFEIKAGETDCPMTAETASVEPSEDNSLYHGIIPLRVSTGRPSAPAEDSGTANTLAALAPLSFGLSTGNRHGTQGFSASGGSSLFSSSGLSPLLLSPVDILGMLKDSDKSQG